MTDPLFDVRGKIVLLTGATGGMGVMIARGLIERGVITYIAGRDPVRTREMAAELSAAGGSCTALYADLSQPHGPQQLAEQFNACAGRLDALLNNAGTSATGALSQMTTAEWDLVMDVNLRAGFFLVQQLLPALLHAARAEDPSRIINIGSIGGLHVPNWEAHSYGASKAALHHVTRSLAKSLGRRHIIVNAIAPGPFPSKLTDTTADAVRRSIDTYVPLGRAGCPQDIVGTVVFLMSRAGAYVNGSTLALDGGYIAAL